MSLKAEAIANALRLVLSGEKFIPADLLTEGYGTREATNTGAGEAVDSLLGRLSRREGEVLEQLLQGLSNKEIGRVLNIREVTVKLHLRSIFRKIGVKTRTQVVKAVFVAGWRG